MILIVNTATKCGFAYQFKELQQLYEKYQKEGFEIIGFPCNQFLSQEPVSNSQMKELCELNYGVSFMLTEKVDVNGSNTHPVFKYLKKEIKGTFGKRIKWNFTKFLIDQDGQVINRFAPSQSPLKLENTIHQLLSKL